MSAPARPPRTAGPPRSRATLIVAAVAALATVAFVLTASKASEIVLIVDPGEVVRSGYTVSKTVSNSAAAITLGTAFLAAVAVPRHASSQHSLFRLLRGAAALWAVSGLAASIFTFANISGVPLSEAGTAAFWAQFAFYSTGIELGRAWTITIAMAALSAAWSTLARSPGHAAALTALGALALIPLAQQGHAAGSASHNLAVVSILMHVLFASIWVGGLVALVWLRRTLPGAAFPVVLRRYSAIAFAAFVAVALSGLVSASIRLTDPGTLLTTSYGLIVLGKITVLVLIGALGVIYRRWLLPQVTSGRTRLFWALVGAEVIFMGLASGLAGVLARTAPPGAEQEIYETGPVTPAESLTGSPFPAPPTWRTLFDGQPDPFWLLLVIFAAASYSLSVRTLRSRGSTWPWQRTAAFMAGIVLTVWVTCGPLSIYATYFLSAYTITIVVLILAGACLAQGRPVLLARATSAPRTDGTKGAREWAGAVLTAPARVVTGSPLSAGLTVLVVLGLAMASVGMRWAVTEPLGRLVVLAAVLVTGTVLGHTVRAAVTKRRPADVVLIGIITAVALAGVAVTLLGPTLMLDWFKTMNPGGHPAADADQRLSSITLFASAAITAAVALLATARALAPEGSATSTPTPSKDSPA